MNAVLQKWLADRMNTPGILGAGIYLSDGSSFCHSTDEQFSSEKVQKILHHLARSQLQLTEADLSPRWSTWMFEQGKLRCVVRPDGLLFGFAVRSETEAAQKLNQISRDFLALESEDTGPV